MEEGNYVFEHRAIPANLVAEPPANPGPQNPIAARSACFNSTLVSYVLQEDRLLRGLALAIPGNTPYSFVGALNNTFPRVIAAGMLYVQARFNFENSPDSTLIAPAVIAETIAFNLPPDYYLSAAQAPEYVRHVIQHGLSNVYWNALTGMSTEIWNAIPAPNLPAYNNRTGLPGQWPFTAAQIGGLDVTQCYRVLTLLATHSATITRSDELKAVVSYIVALCKMGTFTQGYLDKITNGLQNDLSVEIQLDGEIITRCWNTYGIQIPQAAIRNVFESMLQLIPQYAMRLRLTISQTVGTGLTGFMICVRGMVKNPDFTWELLRRIMPDAFENFSNAVIAVNDDPYYGYNRDLGAAKSTLYKDLVYVCIMLLVTVQGERTLVRYGGRPRSCRQKALVDDMIKQYADRDIGLGEEVEDEERQTINTLIGRFRNWNNYTGDTALNV
uniref:Putative nucleoprotein n=1 Tax=Erysiphe necator associated negative-stranded RNA virus 4 TaxID=2737071 RepID=A0A8E3Z214_9VIRU|nr:putative nucleoprotein [Erysiphe necator associated negative-stranded RNA virus 4]